jgi:putative transcriptional regulator
MENSMANRIANNQPSHSPNVALGGCLLVAAPQWHDEIFEKTVCLVVHHSPEGAVGIVLNRGFHSDASGLMHHLSGGSAPSRKGLLHVGGPDSGPVVALHNCDALAEFRSADGVYLAAQVKHLQALVTAPSQSCDVKIIIGQADWKPGQLDAQFSAGRWLPLPVTPELVFADDHRMWPIAMRHIGNQYVVSITRAIVPRSLQSN